MSLHVVVGAGPVGTTTARLLAARGDRVRIVTRSGGGPHDTAIERVAADATNPATLQELVHGASALYACAAPPYWRWKQDFPPLAASLLATAEATGALLVHLNNLYCYGAVDGPITQDMPLNANTVKGRIRAQIWRDALAAHQSGRARVTEARASDYIGAGAVSFLTEMALKPALAGKRALVPADLDAPHTWTHVGDTARTLIALADNERAWGRAWHVPNQPAISVRDITARAAQLAGAPAPKLTVMPNWALRATGLIAPLAGDTAKLAGELHEVAYQRLRPWLVDSTSTSTEFGLKPTPLDQALAETNSPYPPAARRE